MRKVFGILLIIVGLITIMKVLPLLSGLETIGAIIGVSIVTFLPAYFLLRRSTSDE